MQGDFSLSETLSIPDGKNIILDLNGKTLSSSNSYGVSVSGNLTVIDSTAGSDPSVDANYDVTYSSGSITNSSRGTCVYVEKGGVFTLESGSIIATAGNGAYAYGDLTYGDNRQEVASTININGGYVHAQEAGVAVAGLGAAANISGGVIETVDNFVVGGNGTYTEKDGDFGGTTININGGTMIGNITTSGYIACGVYHPQNGTLNITGGTIYANGGVGVLMRAGSANITGGQIIATGEKSGGVGDAKREISPYGVVYDEAANYPGAEDTDLVTISGTASVSSEIGVLSVIQSDSSEEQGKITVTGGTFSGVTTDINDFIAPGNSFDTTTGTVSAAPDAVAIIGTTGYASLQAAVTAAQDNVQTTIVLNANTNENVEIPAGKNIVLDLNGYTLDGGTTSGTPALMNNGTVVIQDNSAAGTGTIKRSDNGPSGTYYTIRNEGTMTIEGGNVNNNAGSPTQWSGSSLIANGVSQTATLNISGGTISQDNFIAVKNDEKGTLNITGGTISSQTQAVQNWCEASISGGRLTGAVTTWAYASYDGETTISGSAYIDGDVGVYWYGGNNSNTTQDGVQPKVTIEGGSITGNLIKAVNENNVNQSVDPDQLTDKATISVKGGNFGRPVNAFYLDDSLNVELVKPSQQDTPYSYYPTVEEALNIAESGDTINVLSGNTTDEKHTVTIKYDNGNADLIYTVYGETDITLPAAPTRSGYSFQGWSDGTTTYQAGTEVTVSGNMTFTAVWRSTAQPPSNYNYQVTLKDADNGTLSVAKEDQWANKGEKITVTVTPDEGYMLDELTITSNGKEIEYVDNEDGTITFTMPEGAVTIEATFVVDPDYEKPEEPEEPVEPSMPFTDVNDGDWFYDVVQYVYDNGLMTGTSATTFEPNTATTRGMIVSILHRLEGSPAVTDENFSDVSSDDWYGQAVAWAASEGIVGGYGDGTFQPNKAITREEMASILYRYSEYKGFDVSDRANLSGYTDAPSDWAVEVMQWANAEGLINGVTNTTLDAQGNATRAQVAAMFQRYLENVAK